jgi:hypothetical protein
MLVEEQDDSSSIKALNDEFGDVLQLRNPKTTLESNIQFGFNCKYFNARHGRCRKLQEDYMNGTNPLCVEKIDVNASTALEILNVSPDSLLGLIEKNVIRVNQSSNKLTYRIPDTRKHDTCYIAKCGGNCIYFAAHNNHKIECLKDLKSFSPWNYDYNHPTNTDGITGDIDNMKVVLEKAKELGKKLDHAVLCHLSKEQ